MQKIFLGILLFSTATFLSYSYFHIKNEALFQASVLQASASRKVHVTPTPTLTPTAVPTSTPIPTPTLIQKNVSPTPTVEPSFSKKQNTSAEPKESVQGYLMRKVNEYRQSQGLGNVTTDSHTCSFARTRLQEVSAAFNHDGFRNRLDSKTFPYPTYSEVTENIAMNSDYTKVVEKWINSSGHAENMRKDTPFVCVESQGNYYVYVGWKP